MPGYKYYIKVILGALALFAAYQVLLNVTGGEELRIRKFILQGKQAAEAKNIVKCAGLVSEDYRDKYGNDKSSLIYTGNQIFQYYKNIFIRIEKMEIGVAADKGRASATVAALVIGKPQQGSQEKILEGERGSVKASLVKEKGKWRLLELEFLEPVSIMGQQIS